MDLLKKIEVEVKVVFVLQKFCYEIEHVHPKCERLEIMHLHPKNVFETLFENFLPGTLKGQKGRGPRNDALATQFHRQPRSQVLSSSDLSLGDGEHGLSSL